PLHHLPSFPTRRSSDLSASFLPRQQGAPIPHRHSVTFPLSILRLAGLFVRRAPERVPGGSHPHYLGLRNFRMNWSVCPRIVWSRSEEHTSELQSRFDLV